MVMVAQGRPQVQWMAPASLWPGLAGAQGAAAQDHDPLRRPVLLRFATDEFMQEFMGVLSNEPQRLHEWKARPETWHTPHDQPDAVNKLPSVARSLSRWQLAHVAPGVRKAALIASSSGGAIPPDEEEPLKLYQAAHQRFYLVTASLVCRVPGGPDRSLDTGAGEQADFVIRRLVGGDEYAFVPGEQGGRWEKVDDPCTLLTDGLVPIEERLPLFGVGYVGEQGWKRRLLAGLVPVARRETYLGAAVVSTEPAPPPDTSVQAPMKAHEAQFQLHVAQPWRNLRQQGIVADRATSTKGIGQPALSQAQQDAINTAVDAVKTDRSNLLSWYIVLDLAAYLKRYIPHLWSVIAGSSGVRGDLNGEPAAQALFDWLSSASQAGRSLLVVLRGIAAAEPQAIEQFGGLPVNSAPPAHLRFNLDKFGDPAPLETRVANALPDDPPAHTPPLPFAAQQSIQDGGDPGWFVIRCVFERPDCAPPASHLLSAPTQRFQMASFFDPEAPARPIRVTLPIDTTPAGLRRFAKNTAFVMSDVLACQVKGAQGLSFGDLVLAVLPWPFHKSLSLGDVEGCIEGDSNGMVCTLSIPIITICALILLIVIASLLDYVFKWMPYFIACFPLPGLKARRTAS